MDRIYCDTDTLFSNIKRHENEPKARRELEALEELLAYHRAGKAEMFRSLVNRRELEETKNLSQLEKLRADYESYRRCRRMKGHTVLIFSLLTRAVDALAIR